MTAGELQVIAGMAAVTYVTRISGLILLRGRTIPTRASAVLRHLPGSLLVALVVPAIIAEGIPLLATAGVTVVLARRTSGMLVPLVGALLTVACWRAVAGG